MQRFARGEAFDERAMPALDSEAIDFPAASESFAEVRRLGKKNMEEDKDSYGRRMLEGAGG